MSGNHDTDILERMAAARREAEQLKEKIRARHDALADTTCKGLKGKDLVTRNKSNEIFDFLKFSERKGTANRKNPAINDQSTAYTERAFGQDIRDAMGV